MRDSATGSPKTILKTGFKAGIIKDDGYLWDKGAGGKKQRNLRL